MASQYHGMGTYTWNVYGTNKTTGEFYTSVEAPSPGDEHSDPGKFSYVSVSGYKVWSVSPYGLQASGLNMAAEVGDVYREDRGKTWGIGSGNASRFNPSVRDWYTRTKVDRTIPVRVYYWGPGSIDVTETVYVTVPKRNSKTISFDANGGSGEVPQSIQKFYKYDEPAPSASLTRTGCSFAGWSFERLDPEVSVPTGIIAPGSQITSDEAGETTLYAVWKLEYVIPTIGPVSSVRVMEQGEPTSEVNVTFDVVTGRNLPSEQYPTISASGVSVDHTDQGYLSQSVSVSQDLVVDNLFHVSINYFLGDIDNSDSMRVTVVDSNGMSASTTTNVSAPGVAIHATGVPGTGSFGFGINMFARGGYIEMRSANGILYNDGPAVIFEGDWIGDHSEPLVGVDISSFVAIEVFCVDDDGNDFSSRFDITDSFKTITIDGVQTDICGMFLVDASFGNSRTGRAFTKTLSFYFDLSGDDPEISTMYGHAVINHYNGSIDTTTAGVHIRKIVGHTTLMGMTSVSGGGGGSVSSVNGKTGNVVLYGSDIFIDSGSSTRLNQSVTNMSVANETLTIWRGSIPV